MQAGPNLLDQNPSAPVEDESGADEEGEEEMEQAFDEDDSEEEIDPNSKKVRDQLALI